MPERWTSTKLLSASTFPLKSRQMPEIPTFPRRLLRAYRPRSHARKTGGPAQLSTMRPVQSVNHAPGLYRIDPQPFRAGLMFWRPALRASHPWLFCSVISSLNATGKSYPPTARFTAGWTGRDRRGRLDNKVMGSATPWPWGRRMDRARTTAATQFRSNYGSGAGARPSTKLVRSAAAPGAP
jgi:hypothetical protein